ncbi:MAG: MerR family transcriptional regulator, partial [Planctomycetota bacterium]
QSGLSRQVIYNYATLGLLRPVSVNRAGHKLFDATALVRIQLIQNLVARGYTLRDIRQIFFRER